MVFKFVYLRTATVLGISISLVYLALLFFNSTTRYNFPAATVSAGDHASLMMTSAWRESLHNRSWHSVEEHQNLLQELGDLETWRSFQSLRRQATSIIKAHSRNHNSSGYLFAEIVGEFHDIQSAICDLVVVARLLNTTLLVPHLRDVAESKDISSENKGFGYIYDERHFIAALADDVHIIERPPKTLQAAWEVRDLSTRTPPRLAPVEYYLQEVLPELQANGAVYLHLFEGGILESFLPTKLSDLQRLRYRVAFHALRFRRDVQELGLAMVKRLRALRQPYVAVYLGLERDTLAYHGCAELFQDVQTEWIQTKRASMIKLGQAKGELNVDSEQQLQEGHCPLLPASVSEILYIVANLTLNPFT